MNPTVDNATTPTMRPFEASLPMALLRAREAAMRLFRPMLADYGLTEQQWRVLRALTGAGASLDAGDLARETFVLAPSLSRMLSALEQRGLIEREVDADDQRRSLIKLSADGTDLVAKVAPHSEARYRAIESTFGADRLAALIDELHELADIDLAGIELADIELAGGAP